MKTKPVCSGIHFILVRLSFISFLFVTISVALHAQCNSTLNKLLPDGSINNDDRYGSALAATDQYMVVAAENSDTTGIFYGGAAYVFEKTAAGWAYRAMLIPSDPDEYNFFGNKLSIDASGNTIVIINRSYKNGGVYIFEKPASGWKTMTESVKITLPVYLEFNSAVDISDNGLTIAITNPQLEPAQFFVLQKPAGGWNSAAVLQTINGPSIGFIGVNILLQDNYLYLSSDNDISESPGIYIYKVNGASYDYLAKLSVSIPFGQIGYFGKYLTIHGDMIATMGAVSELGNEGLKLFMFKKKGEWADATETSQVKLNDQGKESYRFPFPIQFISSTELVASLLIKEGEYYTGKVMVFTAADPSWQNLSSEVIFQQQDLSSMSEFAGQMVWNGANLIRTVGIVPAGLSGRYSAVSMTRSGNIWEGLQQVSISRNSSSNVNFGSVVVNTKDVLFAGAPYDGFSGNGAGAVFIYEKTANDLIQTHKIVPSRRKTRPAGGVGCWIRI